MRGQRHAPAALYPEKYPEPIVQEAAWASEPVWTSAENLAPTGIRSPDCPAGSQSLHRLSYPANLLFQAWELIPEEFERWRNCSCYITERVLRLWLV